MEYFILFFLLSYAVKYLCYDEYPIRKDKLSGHSRFLQEEILAREQLPADLTKWLLTADARSLKTVNYDTIRKGLWAIKRLDLRPDVKEQLWDILKDTRSPKEIKADLIIEMESLVASIPEPDLFLFNMSDWQLVEHLGRKPLTRRKMGILAMAYCKLHPNEDIIKSANSISHIRGLLCGFSLYDLERITPDTIVHLDRDVCHYLLPCTRMQLNVLYRKFTLPEAYGPSFTWSDEDVHRLGLVLLEATTEEIGKIPPKSFGGLSVSVVELLADEQIQAFTPEQVGYLNEEALEKYHQRVEHSSGASNIKGLLQNIWFYLFATVWKLR